MGERSGRWQLQPTLLTKLVVRGRVLWCLEAKHSDGIGSHWPAAQLDWIGGLVLVRTSTEISVSYSSPWHLLLYYTCIPHWLIIGDFGWIRYRARRNSNCAGLCRAIIKLYTFHIVSKTLKIKDSFYSCCAYKVRNKGRHGFYFSLNAIRAIEWRWMRGAGHTACMSEVIYT
jgi:hypothetical protein